MSAPLRVLLVTPWENACGIAENSWYLTQAVEAADPTIEIVPCPEALDPYRLLYDTGWTQDPLPLIHLNYHAALHSRWGVDQIAKVQALGAKVVVTFHDSGVPNTDHCRLICAQADAAVVHEPFDDLPEGTRYWRMGVPGWAAPCIFDRSMTSWCGPRPILGSIGFAFPWKHYEELARVTGEIGWALLLIAPSATEAQIVAWRALNPHLQVYRDFVPRHEALTLLAGCDATAFTYVCHNPGQSGAILQGIAARKPVIALSTCRQFRALYQDPLGREAIRWCETFEEVSFALRTASIERCDPGIVALAEQESWAKLGAKYAALYQEIARGA